MSKDTYIPRNEVVAINGEFNKVRKQAEAALMQLPGVVAVRDSKDRQGPVLTFAPASWASFVAHAKQALAGQVTAE